jgi:hypothetical protein
MSGFFRLWFGFLGLLALSGIIAFIYNGGAA